MIHNPSVNADLRAMGIQFIMDTQGNQLVEWDALTKDNIVIIPAFGTTLEIEDKLKDIGIELKKYDTTCPFVTKVWKQSEKLGQKEYTVIIHGKHKHEETRATFSHSAKFSNSIVVKDMEEAQKLGQFIQGKMSVKTFNEELKNYTSTGFDPKKHLQRLGVVNQTTMLATETIAISDYFKNLMSEKYGSENLAKHFADTRDTLCYATNDNQQATFGLLKETADMAIVVGGFNSSNTSHLAELCEQKLPTYFISSAEDIVSDQKIRHFDYNNKQMLISKEYIPKKDKVRIILTSGASCPDAVVDGVLDRMLSFFPNRKNKESILESFEL